MSKIVPKVMINMNEYIPSGILGKRVKLDQLAQNGGVSWYSKPLASVREAVAA